jgi:hypothetical protein
MNAMDSERQDDTLDPIDRAISSRLAKLRTMPVDTARLEKSIRAQLPEFAEAADKSVIPEPRRRVHWLSPLRAIAASFLLLTAVVTVLLLTSSSGPAQASPSEMAQMHQDLVSGRVPVMQVNSIAEAGNALNQQWPDRPDLPNAPDSHVMACCMKSVKDKKVACVLLHSEGVPITMTVARAKDMQMPNSGTVMHGGVTYHVQASGDLNMVMTEREGRWVCLIGQVPAERLMTIAGDLRF